MTYRKTYYYYLIIIISIFFATISYSQEVNDSDLLAYKAPSPKFHNLILQSHKGLPRFGLLNNYKKNTNTPGRHKTERQDPATRENNKKIQLGYHNYFKMVTFKYLDNIYKDLDRERLTKTPTTNATEKQKNSYAAQQYLRSLLTLCVGEKCKNSLNGINEFERLRNYKTFVYENLDDLRKWSSTFFKNNTTIGYYVTKIRLASYDFDKNGYWVFLNLNIDVANNRTTYTSFEPKTKYENNLMNESGSQPNRMRPLQIFLSISPEKAEKFQLNNIRNLYLVRKIKMTHKEIVSGYNTLLKLTYQHESPTLEIYQDIALTKKIEILSLDKLILKEQ